MPNLLFPELVTVRLVTSSGAPFRCADILVNIHLSARRKNDFHLGPYPTNAEGVASFTREDMRASVDDTYASGLMDYGPVEECFPRVLILLSTPESISKALEARTKVWTLLFKGEKRRWKSIEELRSLYRRAAEAIQNISVLPPARLQAEWTNATAKYEYSFEVEAAA
jgi:hypothetical protein